MKEQTMNTELIPAGCKVTLPSRPITDRRFRYTDAANTDVRRTWRKARLLLRIRGVVV